MLLQHFTLSLKVVSNWSSNVNPTRNNSLFFHLFHSNISFWNFWIFMQYFNTIRNDFKIQLLASKTFSLKKYYKFVELNPRPLANAKALPFQSLFSHSINNFTYRIFISHNNSKCHNKNWYHKNILSHYDCVYSSTKLKFIMKTFTEITVNL